MYHLRVQIVIVIVIVIDLKKVFERSNWPRMILVNDYCSFKNNDDIIHHAHGID